MSGRARGYTMTVNNYKIEELENIKRELHSNTVESYIIGKEVGSNGTPHLQIYVYFKNAKSFNSVKVMFPRAHIEKAKGNKEQNFNYCSKDGAYEEHNMKSKEKKKLYTSIEEDVEATLFKKEIDKMNQDEWASDYVNELKWRNKDYDVYTEEEIHDYPETDEE